MHDRGPPFSAARAALSALRALAPGRRAAARQRVAEGGQTRHAEKVTRVAEQLRQRRGPEPVSLRKRAVSHMVPKRGDLRRSDPKIDISDFCEILEIDPIKKICVAEAGVTFVDLVAATLRHGLVPIVVPELKTITIGGAVSGCSIESMSFRYGGFHDTCLEYELITATGEVLVCTPENEHALIFQMVHGAFGTLGVLSRLTFRLIPAKPFVKLTYEKHPSIDAYMAAIAGRFARQDVDFMDGIIHASSECVLSLGEFVDEAPYTSSYDWYKIYYESTRERREDYMRAADYFFRYDRGVTNVRPRAPILRALLGWYLNSSRVLRLAERMNWLLRRDNPPVTLDVFVPLSKVPEFIRWYEREFGYFPLWCVPYRRVRDYEWIADRWYQGMKDQLFVDLAIYGMDKRDGRNYHRLMEEKLAEIGGIKTLISHNFYSEAEFWSLWNKPNYDAVKARTDPNNLFRDLYTKTCRAAQGLR